MNILLVSPNQFGYLVDYYQYVGFLTKQGHSVTYLSWDYNKTRIDPENPAAIYVSRSGNKLARFVRFVRSTVSHTKANKYDKIIIKYFPFVSLLVFFIDRKSLILDIRTVSAHPGKWNRFFRDIFLKIESLFFSKVSVISQSAAKYLKISEYSLLPLGGSAFEYSTPSVNGGSKIPRLSKNDRVFIYVGTLENRNMLECVKGFHLYYKKTSDAGLKFFVIGDGPQGQLTEIKKYIEANSLGNQIYTFGYVPQIELGKFFELAECGVSFVPITSYYNVQPPTKTLEYLINGLPVLATDTLENRNIIEDCPFTSGVLIDDNAEAVCEGLIKITGLNLMKKQDAIREYYQAHKWENVLSQYLPSVIR